MSKRRVAIGSFIHRHAAAVIGGGVALALVLGLGLTQLGFETSQDSLIGAGSDVARDNRAFQEQFGGDAMLGLYTAEPGHKVEELFVGENLDRMRRLDAQLRDSGQFHAVLSPLTLLELSAAEFAIAPELVTSAAERVEAETRADAAARGLSDIDTEAAVEEAVAQVVGPLFQDRGRYEAMLEESAAAGFKGDAVFTIENPSFVQLLIYADAEETRVRSALESAFPDPVHGVVVARLQGNVEINAMGEGAQFIRDAMAEHQPEGFTIVASGTPVLLDSINDYLQGGMATLGALAMVVMVVVLFFVFRVRQRLLPLAVVLFGLVWAFGVMGFVGIPLNMVTISGFPILLGLGVDFAIQTQCRFEEEVDKDGDPRAAVQRVLGSFAPALVVAFVAAAAGFLALRLSHVPLIRDFGLMLAVGVIGLFLAAVVLPLAMLVIAERRHPTEAGMSHLPHGALERFVRSAVFVSRRRVVPLMLVGALVIVAGLAVEGRFDINSEPERWINPNGAAVGSLEELRAATNTSSDISLIIEADDVRSTEIVSWMERYATAQLDKHPQELLSRAHMGSPVSDVTYTPPTAEEVELLHGIVPDDFLRSFVSEDGTKAALVFPIADVTLDARGELLDEMAADLEDPALAPPPGTSVRPAGIAVIGVEIVKALDANRALITWAAIGAVFLWLLVFYRKLLLSVLPLVPVLFAVSLASLVTYMAGFELTPLTSVTAPLVIAVCTEFSVLVMARYMEERERGLYPEEAVEHGAVRIGRAFTASGLTLVAGFGVLGFSSFPLLRDFGIVVALDVLVALACALVVLPPLLMWVDRHPRIATFGWPHFPERGAELPLAPQEHIPA